MWIGYCVKHGHNYVQQEGCQDCKRERLNKTNQITGDKTNV